MRYSKFLYSVGDEKFYWRLLLPKRGVAVAKSVEDIEWRKVCVDRQRHLNLLQVYEI